MSESKRYTVSVDDELIYTTDNVDFAADVATALHEYASKWWRTVQVVDRDFVSPQEESE
jgi:hypothetical protein